MELRSVNLSLEEGVVFGVFKLNFWGNESN